MAEHLLASIINLLYGAVIEFVKFAFERYNNILFTILGVDGFQLGLLRSGNLTLLNEWISGAEEFLEDLVVVSHIDIAKEFVLALGYSILETVFAILVIDAFLDWIRKNFVSFAETSESTVGLGFLILGVA